MAQPDQKIPPKTAKALSARLMAAQALYQLMQNDEKPVQLVVEQYIQDAAEGVEIDGESLVPPDGALLKAIIEGAHSRWDDLETIIQANFQKGKEPRAIEPLLKAILMAASYELMAHHDIDSPILINDYLNVAHGFFEKGEVSLINANLDVIAKAVRD